MTHPHVSLKQVVTLESRTGEGNKALVPLSWSPVGKGLDSIYCHCSEVHRQRNVFSAFNSSLVIKEQWAAVKQLGVQCLAHGHLDFQPMGRAGIEPMTLGLQDDPLTP